MSKKSDTIKLTNVRLSFPFIFEAKAFEEGGNASFSASFILDKEKHAGLIKEVKAKVNELANEYFKGKVPGSVKQKYPLRDGAEKEEVDGYGESIMFLSARSKTRPTVVDRQLNPVTATDGVIYGGCYVNATIRPWVQDNKFGKRVNFQLRAIQFVKDGPAFGQAPVVAEEEFESLDDEDGGLNLDEEDGGGLLD